MSQPATTATPVEHTPASIDDIMADLDEYDRDTLAYLSYTGVGGALLERVADSLRRTAASTTRNDDA